MRKIFIFLSLALLALTSCEKPPQGGHYVPGAVLEINNDSEYDVLFIITHSSNSFDLIELTLDPHSRIEYEWEKLAQDYGIAPKNDLHIKVETVDSNHMRHKIHEQALELDGYFRYIFTIWWDGTRCDFSYAPDR